MKRSTLESIVATIIFAAIIIPLCAQAQMVGAKDFVQNAAIGGMFEVQSSQVALQRSQNPDVRKFAQMMVDDHNRINAELKSRIPQTTLPATVLPTDLDDKHQALLTSLNNVPQGDFDRLYIADQVDGHMDAVKLFKTYAKTGDDKALQTFASKNLPTLEMHLSRIKALQLSR